jgi:4-oxalocrotonate tautomerase
MDTRYGQVVDALSDYFDGLYHSDTDKLSEVFHPMAHYVCVTDGSFQRLTMDEYFPLVDGRPSPASRDDARHDRIVSIEFAGPVTAFVRAECVIGPKSFTDLLTFIRVDGKWQIISKVFHYDLCT